MRFKCVACTASHSDLHSKVKTRQIYSCVLCLQNKFPPYWNVKIRSYWGGCTVFSMLLFFLHAVWPSLLVTWISKIFRLCWAIWTSLSLKRSLSTHWFEEWDVSWKEQTWTVISSDSIYNHCIILFISFNDAVNIGTETITLRFLGCTEQFTPLSCLLILVCTSIAFSRFSSCSNDAWGVSLFYFILFGIIVEIL